jgi:rhodanese-related sulfurtransferase
LSQPPWSIATVGRDELWQKIERGERFVLIDALSPMSYAASHLPGAVNVQPETVAERATRTIPAEDAEVVVYCSSESCDSSLLVARRLVELGYRNVRHYAGGKDDWAAAGLPLEGGRVRR